MIASGGKNKSKRQRAHKGMMALLLAAAVVFASCSGAANTERTPPKESLDIAYNSDRYGQEWLAAISSAFEKANRDVNVKISNDTQLDIHLSQRLAAGKDLPDLIFATQKNWPYYASKGLLTRLDGLYGQTIDGGKMLAEKVLPSLLDSLRYNGGYYVVPLGGNLTGILYNGSLFEQNGWEIPSTVEELQALMQLMKLQNIAPFAWSVESVGLWGDLVNGWWGQYEGESGMAEYLKMSGPDVYSQQGRLISLQVFQAIAADPMNSIENPLGIDDRKAFSEFYSGRAAMMPAGYLTKALSAYKPPEGFNLKVMPLPAVKGAKQTNINVSDSGDIAAIPAGAKDAALAERFLAFMSTDEMLALFTQKTGIPMPFVYSTQAAQGLTGLPAQAAGIWRQGVRIYLASRNPVYYGTFLDWPATGLPLIEIYSGSMTPQEAFSVNAVYASDNWKSASQK